MALDTAETQDDTTRRPGESPDPAPAAEPRPSSPAITPGPTFDQLMPIPKEVTEGLGDIKQREIASHERIIRQSEGQVSRDRSIAQQHYDAAGVEATKMQPWDAQKEWDKVATSPLEAFGSFASVFAIVASAFTRAPMENALNASAAAMTAIRAGDEKEYERGFSSWKANTDLVQKRFNMQNQLYGDALNLMNTDQNAGRIALQNAALRFGDEKSLFLLRNGMDKELIDLQTSRINQAVAIKKASDQINLSTFQQHAFEQLEEEKNPKKDPQQSVQNWQFAHGVHTPAEQQIFSKFMIDHQNDPDVAEKAVQLVQKMRSARTAGTAEERYVAEADLRYAREHDGTSMPDEMREETRRAYWDAHRAKSRVDKAIEEIQQQNPGVSRVDAEKQYKLAIKVPNYTQAELAQATSTPTFMKSLEILDHFTDHKQLAIHNPQGFIESVPKHLMAEYFGINDPQILYDRALNTARAELGRMSGGRAQLKQALEAQLARLPNRFQDERVAKATTQQLIQSTADEGRRFLSLMEAGGKGLTPELVRDFREVGIYSSSTPREDPVVLLRDHPQELSREQLVELSRKRLQLPPDDRARIIKEAERRNIEAAKVRGPR